MPRAGDIWEIFKFEVSIYFSRLPLCKCKPLIIYFDTEHNNYALLSVP